MLDSLGSKDARAVDDLEEYTGISKETGYELSLEVMMADCFYAYETLLASFSEAPTTSHIVILY